LSIDAQSLGLLMVATVLSLFVVPVFYVVIKQLGASGKDPSPPPAIASPSP
jgi:HAE1 family hydrophobic/amphiphilic exporter-1